MNKTVPVTMDKFGSIDDYEIEERIHYNQEKQEQTTKIDNLVVFIRNILYSIDVPANYERWHIEKIINDYNAGRRTLIFDKPKAFYRILAKKRLR